MVIALLLYNLGSKTAARIKQIWEEFKDRDLDLANIRLSIGLMDSIFWLIGQGKMGPLFKVLSERLEKLMIKPTTLGLQDQWRFLH